MTIPPRAARSSAAPAPPAPAAASGRSRSRRVVSKNSSATFRSAFAEVWMCDAPTDAAYFSAALSSTCRCRSRSILFATIVSVTSRPSIVRSSFTQFLTFWNDSVSVMSYTSSAASVSR
eukprot:Amastigsp_a508965_12.p3 type:complete len:119 gc:universal Amastigsp_a508965_12:126-482(+)